LRRPDGQRGQGQGGQGDVPVPARPAADFVVVEPRLPLGELDRVLDGPARPGRPDDLRERGAEGRLDEVVGDLGRAVRVAAGEQGVDPALPQGGAQQDKRPVVEAGALGALAAAQSLPGQAPAGMAAARSATATCCAGPDGGQAEGFSLPRTAST
jgi:hypothetical protein